MRRTAGTLTSFDLGRGCPVSVLVLHHHQRAGPQEPVPLAPTTWKPIIRENVAQGINRFFITDDNFARNRNWEASLRPPDRAARGAGLRTSSFTIQVDTLCHRIPNFIEKAGRAGVARVFIGLENINPDSLLGAKKKQNRITEYRAMLQAWKSSRRASRTPATSSASPTTRKESIMRDIEIIKRELPVDILEFFILTPLPGSEDHKRPARQGRPGWTPTEQVRPQPPRRRIIRSCRMPSGRTPTGRRGSDYYSPEHMETIMRRAAALRDERRQVMFMMLWFYFSIRYDRVHPLEGGYFRLKFRRDRRPTMPRESALVFYPRYAWETVRSHFWMGYWILKINRVRWRIKKDAARRQYTDLSLSKEEGEYDALSLFTETRGGQGAVAKKRQEAAARAAVRGASAPAVRPASVSALPRTGSAG